MPGKVVIALLPLRCHSLFIFIAGSPNDTQSAIADATQMYHGIES